MLRYGYGSGCASSSMMVAILRRTTAAGTAMVQVAGPEAEGSTRASRRLSKRNAKQNRQCGRVDCIDGMVHFPMVPTRNTVEKPRCSEVSTYLRAAKKHKEEPQHKQTKKADTAEETTLRWCTSIADPPRTKMPGGAQATTTPISTYYYCVHT